MSWARTREGTTRHRRTAPQLDVQELPADVRAAVEGAIAGGSIILHRSGVTIGSLAFGANLLEGTIRRRWAAGFRSGADRSLVLNAVHVPNGRSRRLRGWVPPLAQGALTLHGATGQLAHGASAARA